MIKVITIRILLMAKIKFRSNRGINLHRVNPLFRKRVIFIDATRWPRVAGWGIPILEELDLVFAFRNHSFNDIIGSWKLDSSAGIIRRAGRELILFVLRSNREAPLKI